MRGMRSIILLIWIYKIHVLMLHTCVCTLYLSAWFSSSFAGYLIDCWMCNIHICCSHTCVCFLCCFVWIVIFCRFIGYTSSVYRHTLLTVHIYAHPLSVLSGL